ncbi:glycosyltransferase family 2 protein [Brachybacterium hainanense]|uniref:Glycosyltransferase family 2 protein n=1 Tax=Brachybacterium hainanense TaxID=1541174 RepID=A0ABV6RGY2_9MICO
MTRAPAPLLVIVPAWNEEATVGSTVLELREVVPGADVLVVDDGSTDATGARAAAAGAGVLTLPYNLGVGGAMRAGYRYARRFGYERAVQVDADGQHDPREIPRLLAGLERADISIGSRFADRGAYEVRGPRRWGMILLAVVVSRLAGTRLTDVTSGFRATGRRGIEQYCRCYPTEYLGDTVDSLVVALRSGLTATQVGVHMRPRQGGTPSAHPVQAAGYLLRSLLALLMALTRTPVRPEDRGEPPVPGARAARS